MNEYPVKLLVSLIYSSIVAFSSDLEYIYLLPILYMVVVEYKEVLKILKKLALINLFIIFLVIFVSFHDVNKAIELFFRTNLILLFNLLVFYKSKGYDIVRGFNSLRFPKKFVTIFYFTIVMIEYLFKEFKTIKATLRLRGFYARSNLFSYQTYGNVFAMMFIKSVRKSEEMRDSLISRGFNGEIYLLEMPSKNKNYIFLSILVFIVVINKMVVNL
ncbi:cobalt transport protein [Arcobacter nitrofigilis DSM 7299]|uniref:Cobalt transport protein n=1 Tax=Arcobacter nitrofigilis (strain ATCC 33309 / DSM 7299 / CCUG 15893 / LMG 7604 / NCTC 12251 / CI) TaxID=572480 RepID=D5V6I8_ARCNC|nr:energy-coupling factor transporter transmembrane component T [Arcobacter nitrofigilis]ADG94258.1 cobalt transport protein [Arcobacter nitrofigilis DSM 7299]